MNNSTDDNWTSYNQAKNPSTALMFFSNGKYTEPLIRYEKKFFFYVLLLLFQCVGEIEMDLHSHLNNSTSDQTIFFEGACFRVFCVQKFCWLFFGLYWTKN